MRRFIALLALCPALCVATCGQEPQPPARDAMAESMEAAVRKLTTLRSPWPEGENHEGERHVWQPAQLEEAALWVEAELAKGGLQVRREEYEVTRTGVAVKVRNLVAEVPGRGRKDEIFVVGAHYDTRVAMPGPRAHGPPLPGKRARPGPMTMQAAWPRCWRWPGNSRGSRRSARCGLLHS